MKKKKREEREKGEVPYFYTQEHYGGDLPLKRGAPRGEERRKKKKKKKKKKRTKKQKRSDCLESDAARVGFLVLISRKRNKRVKRSRRKGAKQRGAKASWASLLVTRRLARIRKERGSADSFRKERAAC